MEQIVEYRLFISIKKEKRNSLSPLSARVVFVDGVVPRTPEQILCVGVAMYHHLTHSFLLSVRRLVLFVASLVLTHVRQRSNSSHNNICFFLWSTLLLLAIVRVSVTGGGKRIQSSSSVKIWIRSSILRWRFIQSSEEKNKNLPTLSIISLYFILIDGGCCSSGGGGGDLVSFWSLFDEFPFWLTSFSS